MSETGSGRRQSWRWLFLALGVTVGATMLLVAACGGSKDEDNSDDSGPTATKTTASSRATTDTSGSGGDSGDAASDLSALAANYDDFTGVVKYETTGFGDSFTSMKIYKGENRSRIDYESDQGTGTVISTPDAFYICSEGACIKAPTGDTSIDPTAGLTALLSAENISALYGDIPDGVDVEKSNKEIAGVDATCYTYSGDIDETETGDENGVICVSDSGLLLKMEFHTASADGAFEATEASDEVSDSDFEPPFPVTEIPNIGR